MSFKGSLDSFNLRELLQMLAFNQKVGTLVLQTDRGTKTVYVDHGNMTFVAGDPEADETLWRVLAREAYLPEEDLRRAWLTATESHRSLAAVLREAGFDVAALEEAQTTATGEQFFTLQITEVSQFEFVEGRTVGPDGKDALPLDPPLMVEAVLLDLTRKMDHWAELLRASPAGMREVYEPTGASVDLAPALGTEEMESIDVERVLPHLDGVRSVTEVAASSRVDELTALTVCVVLCRHGAIREVPTTDLEARGEDLLQRGEARRAMAPLARAVERPDAAPTARLRLADALAASGRGAEAAAELLTFADRHASEDPIRVFDALQQAMALERGDAAVVARLCDYYLAHRPALESRRSKAQEGLRLLIHGAVTRRRPLEAARALAAFIEAGDAPPEERLALADLYLSGGERARAASTLFQRAEELVAEGRTTRARELLDRILEIDPARADARAKLRNLTGQSRRRRRRSRVAIFLVLLVLLIGGAGAAWLTWSREVAQIQSHVRTEAEDAVANAVQVVASLEKRFQARVAAARDSEAPVKNLGEIAKSFLAQVERVLHQPDGALRALKTELERPPTGRNSTLENVLHGLEGQISGALTHEQGLVDALADESRKALATGEAAQAGGRFEDAHTMLLHARNLSFADEAVTARSNLLLGQVNRYMAQFETAYAPVKKAKDAGDVDAWFRLGVGVVQKFLDSDLTRKILLPVQIASTPAGASVRLGDRDVAHGTPCQVEYSPFGPTELVVHLPGRVPQRIDLPNFEMIQANDPRVLAFSPHVTARLVEGPSWTVNASREPDEAIDALWAAGKVPVVVTNDGRMVRSIDVAGRCLGATLDHHLDANVRRGGVLPGGIEWQIRGHRTLVVRPPREQTWELPVVGELVKPPARISETLAVLDEAGNLYGLELATGAERWREPLGGRPCHPAYPSPFGFVVSTFTGGVRTVDVRTGKVHDLAPDLQGFTLALPVGQRVLVLNGPRGEYRLLDGTGRQVATGEAHPEDVTPWLSAAGAAWVEADGVHWLAAHAKEPVRVQGLGARPRAISGDDAGNLYAVGSDGRLRAASLDRPDATIWDTQVGSTAEPPLPVGNLLFLLVQGSVLAVER